MRVLDLEQRLAVVLIDTRNPLNIGAAARAMSNFGFTGLRLVNPYEVAYHEARSAVGAAPILSAAREFASLAEAVSDCSLVVGSSSAEHRALHLRDRRTEWPSDRRRDSLHQPFGDDHRTSVDVVSGVIEFRMEGDRQV